MMKLVPLIIEEGLIQNSTTKERKTVRAIITDHQGRLLMVYSQVFDDYTFPGGGLKDGEDEEQALRRELMEELGALAFDVIKPCGITRELRYGIKGSDTVYLQTSMYYLCRIHAFGEQKLEVRELLHGLEPRWVTIDEALRQNESVIADDLHQTKGLKTVLIRENHVLRTLKENNLCANLKSSVSI